MSYKWILIGVPTLGKLEKVGWQNPGFHIQEIVTDQWQGGAGPIQSRSVCARVKQDLRFHLATGKLTVDKNG